PAVRAQLRRQQAEEMAFRSAPFTPLRARTSESVLDEQSDAKDSGKQADNASKNDNQINGNTAASNVDASSNAQTNVSISGPPESYIINCSACHGTRGQGVQKFPKLIGVGSKPRRSVEDIIALLNDPKAYGLEAPMRSYADKLTEDEKREIAEWVASLKSK
ncbi:MAG TPA: cytochrome c, partial [Pyrinomonadaceae bacterium]|nr:cytochrome c [Pyrinomonadaceae bacterium]